MKVLVEINDKNDLRNMLWSGAIDTVNSISNNEAKMILDILEDSYNDTFLTITELNDFFWFDRDIVAQMLGYNSFEEL